jgi:hypothetical protein
MRWRLALAEVAAFVAVLGPVGAAAVYCDVSAQLPKPEVLSKTGNAPPPSRTAAWAQAVEDCEAHGGVAVVRATKALGRSADLPVCVPQLGE